MTEEATAKFEDLPVDCEGPVYVARVRGFSFTFVGETKMQAIRKAREFQAVEGPRARRAKARTTRKSKPKGDENAE